MQNLPTCILAASFCATKWNSGKHQINWLRMSLHRILNFIAFTRKGAGRGRTVVSLPPKLEGTIFPGKFFPGISRREIWYNSILQKWADFALVPMWRQTVPSQLLQDQWSDFYETSRECRRHGPGHFCQVSKKSPHPNVSCLKSHKFSSNSTN